MSSFIEDDYEIPQAPSRYASLEEGKGEAGKNIFRILGSFGEKTAIKGYEFWVTGTDENGKPRRKPIRRRMDEAISPDELEDNPKTGEVDAPKHFWALPAYNYRTKSIQIWEITQKSIIRKILEFARNPKWGDPKDYDVIVYKDMSLPPTQIYSVDHDPKEPISDEIKAALEDWHCNINALFDGLDPFEIDIDDVKMPQTVVTGEISNEEMNKAFPIKEE